jgi:hypothetical protein
MSVKKVTYLALRWVAPRESAGLAQALVVLARRTWVGAAR